MVPTDLATYSENELERLAEQHLHRRPDVLHAAPIDLELLIDQHSEDVSLHLEDDLAARHKVEGGVWKDAHGNHELLVVIDRSLFMGPWAAYNRALGEEYAHLCIHQALLLLVRTVDDFVALQSDPQWARHERDARRFSDAVRMPRDLLAAEASSAYAHAVDEHGFGDSARVLSLVRSRLASRFQTSMPDMRRRLQQPQVALEERLLRSLQACETSLMPESWTVEARPPRTQSTFWKASDFD